MSFQTILAALQDQPRLLIEAELTPVQGNRFQPTGFPDLGAATYKRPDGTAMLLVESAQSMANRLEAMCWDTAKDEIIEPLKGLPHIVVKFADGRQTTSIQEAHRLNSAYLLEADSFKATLTEKITPAFNGALDVRKLAQAIFKLDVGSLLHGVFIAQKDIFGGRARLQRLLSSFIEAEGYEVVTSGGAKIDRLDPKGEAREGGAKGSEEGRGNIIYPRTEFSAAKTVAYFNLDLATTRGYGLSDDEYKLVVALTLFKILRLLNGNLRLRTACDFDLVTLKAVRPSEIDLSDHAALLTEIQAVLPQLIAACTFGKQPLELRSE